MKVRVAKLVCKRCGHDWYPRQADVRICPNCKSANWDRLRKQPKPSTSPESALPFTYIAPKEFADE